MVKGKEEQIDLEDEEIDDFLDAAVPVMKCLKFIQRNHGQVYKHSTFYEQKITKHMKWNDLRGEYKNRTIMEK